MPMAPPQGDALQNQPLRKLQQAIASAISGMSADSLLVDGVLVDGVPADVASLDAWGWHPPGKWCPAEIVEHLYLTYTGTIKGFERMMAAGKPSPGTPTWRHHVARIIVIGFGHMPSGRESPPLARPRGLSKEKALAEIVPHIVEKITEMDDLLTRSEREFGSMPLLDHPIIGPLTAQEWAKFHLVHGMHHVRQIHRLRAAMQKIAAPRKTP